LRAEIKGVEMFARFIKLIAATVVSLGLFGGVALASSGTITGPTGPHSVATITNVSVVVVNVSKTNNAFVGNFNLQGSSTGGVLAAGNTVVGSISTGNSHNSNTTNTTIVQTN